MNTVNQQRNYLMSSYSKQLSSPNMHSLNIPLPHNSVYRNSGEEQKKQHPQNQRNRILSESRMKQRQLSASQHTSLQKQIDNLMIENNNLRSSSKTAGKYQLKLMQKEKQIKAIKQQYQSQINTLKYKLGIGNSVNMNGLSNSRRTVFLQECSNCNRLRQESLQNSKLSIQKKNVNQYKNKQVSNQRQLTTEYRNMRQTINKLENQLNIQKKELLNQQETIQKLKMLQKNLRQQLKNNQTQKLSLQNSNKQLINQNFIINKKLNQLQNTLILQRTHKDQIMLKLQTYIQKQYQLKTNHKNQHKYHQNHTKTINTSLPNISQQSISYSQTIQPNYYQHHSKIPNLLTSPSQNINNTYIEQQLYQLKSQMRNLLDATTFKSVDQTEVAQLKQQVKIQTKTSQTLSKQVQRLCDVITNKDKQLTKLRNTETINTTLSRRVESLQKRNWKLIQQVNKCGFCENKKLQNTIKKNNIIGIHENTIKQIDSHNRSFNEGNYVGEFKQQNDSIQYIPHQGSYKPSINQIDAQNNLNNRILNYNQIQEKNQQNFMKNSPIRKKPIKVANNMKSSNIITNGTTQVFFSFGQRQKPVQRGRSTQTLGKSDSNIWSQEKKNIINYNSVIPGNFIVNNQQTGTSQLLNLHKKIQQLKEQNKVINELLNSRTR